MQVDLSLLGERNEGVRISGDFFATSPIEELEAALVGHTLSDALTMDPSVFIAGMTSAELCALLRGENE